MPLTSERKKASVIKQENESNAFLQDVLKGLMATDKHLNSKYFYDKRGDELFQKIMACPEYYLTRCEMEIFTSQTKALASTFISKYSDFDVIELGAGDATKSIHLLQELVANDVKFTYYPVDISKNVIKLLNKEIPQKLPSLQIHGLNGEYFVMLEKSKTLSDKFKVVLFLGGNIGNVPLDNVEEFCTELRSHLCSGDTVLIGFDLKKDPELILNAYNDKAGHTRDFNLNPLMRINEELNGNFIIENFKHYPSYDPATGTCKSYLVSKVAQIAEVGGSTILFLEGEAIHTEISQKYTQKQINKLAEASGFIPISNFYDSKKWFVDSVWQVR